MVGSALPCKGERVIAGKGRALQTEGLQGAQVGLGMSFRLINELLRAFRPDSTRGD